jgi:pimeloyl-ACP methyl ester carboxylesterase
VRARFVVAGGERVRIAECGDAGAPPVLLVHGWGVSLFTWRHVLPALGAAGFHAMAFDLRGHGLSAKPAGEAAYTAAAMVAHVRAVRDTLGIERGALAAMSMGAVLVRELMLEDPSRVSHLAWISPAGFGRIRRREMGRLFSPRLLAPLIARIVPRFAVAHSMARTYGPNGAPLARDIDDYWAPSQFPEFVLASRHLLHAFDWAPPDPSRFARADLPPMLALLGTHDRLIDLDATEAYLAAYVPSCRIEIVEGGGHALHEDTPSEANRLLAALLRS